MNTPEQYLQAAIEKVAKEAPVIYAYNNYVILAQDAKDLDTKISKIVRGDRDGFYTVERWNHKISLLALQLQQEDAEKEVRQRTIWYDNLMSEKNEVVSDYKSVIEQLKAELQDVIKEKWDIVGDADKTIKELQSTLSQEKAKAFDEGGYHVMKELGYANFDFVNPYKQDTQPKQ